VSQPPYQPPGQPPGPPPDPPPEGAGWPTPLPATPAKKPKAPLLAGMLIGAVAPWFFSLVPLILTNGNTAAGYGLYAWVLVPLAGIVLLLVPKTRRWGLGVLIGFFGMLIIGAGACLTIVVGLNASGGFS